MEPYLPYLFIAILLGVYLANVPVMVIIERKLSAWLQYRVGPNRVGSDNVCFSGEMFTENQ